MVLAKGLHKDWITDEVDGQELDAKPEAMGQQRMV